ncbi:MAG TPA: TIGR03435 family protein, partial [Vicinamibacterales bacterium]|nr:TIGR03435 family protein [Vicinamibacterales bacterium]
PIAALAGLLSALPATGRPVLDRTGLTGRYTFSVNLQDLPAGASPADQKSADFRSDTPAFTALQEQLGLKLVPDRASIEMLVVDHADRIPTDD